MATKKKQDGRTTLGVSPEHGDALRHAAVDLKGMTTKGVLDAIIEGDEDVWKAVVAEYKRRKRSRRRK
jgi:hypothetical protein